MLEMQTRKHFRDLVDAGRPLRVGVHPGAVDHLLRALPAAVLDAAGWSVLAAALRSRPRIDRDALGNPDLLARHLLWLRTADEELAQVISLTRPARRPKIGSPAAIAAISDHLLGVATWDGINQVRQQLRTPALVEAGQVVTDLLERACYLATRFGTGHQLTGLDIRPHWHGSSAMTADLGPAGAAAAHPVLAAADRREQRLSTRAARRDIARQARTRHQRQHFTSLNRRVR